MVTQKRQKVFLVDDDTFLLSSLKMVLINAGYDVETATRGKEALCKVQKALPDLFVIDAVMPEMNGFELSRQIRNIENAGKLPIIMLTGLKTESDASLAFGSGVNEFIKKPVKPEDLVRKIRNRLNPQPY